MARLIPPQLADAAAVSPAERVLYRELAGQLGPEWTLLALEQCRRLDRQGFRCSWSCATLARPGGSSHTWPWNGSRPSRGRTRRAPW